MAAVTGSANFFMTVFLTVVDICEILTCTAFENLEQFLIAAVDIVKEFWRDQRGRGQWRERPLPLACEPTHVASKLPRPPSPEVPSLKTQAGHTSENIKRDHRGR